MSSSTVLIFLAFLCMATAFFETSYETYTKQELIDGLLHRDSQYREQRTVNRAYPQDCNSTVAPQDDGSGSYGDLLHRDRLSGDQLLLRETFLNEYRQWDESIVFWYGNFNSSYVTHVRSLNFGRERGWTKSIHVSNNNTYNNVEINLIVPANKTVRLFFEVYGYPRTSNRTALDLN